jgi:PKHD-type hydroxylase
MSYTTIYNDPFSRAKAIEPWAFWDNAFTTEELKKIEDYCDEQGTKRGTLFGKQDIDDVEKHRTSNVGFHDRNTDTAWIFDRLNFVIQSANEMFFNYHLNGYSFFQYTTYNAEELGRYDWHMDIALAGGSRVNNDPQPRKLSLTLMLNDDFEGGNFQINVSKEENSETIDVPKGRAILFPSFILHRVTPVTKGVRKSLVIWTLGPKFV